MTRNDAPMLMLMLLLSQLVIVDLYHYLVENKMKILAQPQTLTHGLVLAFQLKVEIWHFPGLLRASQLHYASFHIPATTLYSDRKPRKQRAICMYGTFSWEKNDFVLDFVQIISTHPLSPKFGQLVQLFSDVEIQDLKVSLGLKILYIYNLKKQFKDKMMILLDQQREVRANI